MGYGLKNARVGCALRVEGAFWRLKSETTDESTGTQHVHIMFDLAPENWVLPPEQREAVI